MTATLRRAHGVTRRNVRPLIAALIVGVFALAWWGVHQQMPGWYARMWFPLRHEQTIREHADRHRLDPALVASMIENESGWTPDTRSDAGAVGLMQLLPQTARFIAQQPNRPSPAPDRLTDPEVNIAYGTWYLRYLIDRHGSVPAAIAAYNAGEQNVRRWEAAAAAEGRSFDERDIAFPETRSFVASVLEEAEIYRRAYGDELGPPVDGLARLPGRSRSLER